jgi:hypothetical protein
MVGERHGDECRVAEWGERDEDGAIGECSVQLPCNFKRQLGLANAARAGEGHKPHIVAPDALLDYHATSLSVWKLYR